MNNITPYDLWVTTFVLSSIFFITFLVKFISSKPNFKSDAVPGSINFSILLGLLIELALAVYSATQIFHLP